MAVKVCWERPAGPLRELGRLLTNVLFPPRCVTCRRLGAQWCATCRASVRWLHPPLCPRCGQPQRVRQACDTCRRLSPSLNGVRSVALFEGSLRQAIHAFKYSGQSSLAEPLGELLVSYWAESPLPVDSLVPVPLHPTRQRQRGYNQSSLLATRLAAAAHLPLVEGCLVRVRATASQMTLGVPERQRNVEGAFRCVDSRLAGQRVLLVDDVCTSACTLGACSTALCESGVASVWALTLARAV